MSHKVSTSTYIFSYVLSLYIFVCFFYCFCIKRGAKATTRSIKFVWAFIIAACLSKIYTDTMAWVMSRKDKQGASDEKMHTLQVWEWIGEDLEQLSTTFAHWVFAMSYFETALLFPVMLSYHSVEAIVAKTKQVSRIAVILNIIFYSTQVAFIVTDWLTYIIPWQICFTVALLAAYEPCIVLLFSIRYLRTQIKRQNQRLEQFI